MNHDDPFADHPSETPDPPPTPPPLPAPTTQAPPRGYGNCTACGADLTGSSIGGACQHCGQPIGTGVDAFGHTMRTNGFAITSMVLGIISIPVCFCYGVFSLIIGAIGLTFGILAGRQIAQGGYSEGSRGMALAGKICSGIGIALGLAYIIIFIGAMYFAISTAPQPTTPAPVMPSQPASPTYTPSRSPGSSSGLPQWQSGENRATRPSVVVGPDGRIRPALPNGMEYAPNGQVRPSAPQGLEYSPNGTLQPSIPTPGAPMPGYSAP